MAKKNWRWSGVSLKMDSLNRPLFGHFGRSPIVLVPSAICETSVWVDEVGTGLTLDWEIGDDRLNILRLFDSSSVNTLRSVPIVDLFLG